MDILILAKMIKELHIEASSNCQAECPMCTRTVKHVQNTSDLTVAWFIDNIDASTLTKIMFCGNVGDSAMNKELLDICIHLKSQNPDLIIGLNTNGAVQSMSWWRRLGTILSNIEDYVVFSIDGTEETNHIYRKNVSWKRLMINVASFIDSGGSAHWDMLVFDHNKHEVDECIETANNMGFSWFRGKESSRWSVYPPGTDGLFPVDNSWQDSTILEEIQCEANIDSSRYYDANGLEWPCCHIANDHYLNNGLENFSNIQLLDNYNERLKTSPYDVCRRACGTSARKGQWRQNINLKQENKHE